MHTHLLVLGSIFLLVVLALEKVIALSQAAPRAFTWFYWLWTLGVAVTGGMMLIKGTLMVLVNDAGSAALAGIVVLGHSALAAGVIALFIAVRAAVKAAETMVSGAPALAGP